MTEYKSQEQFAFMSLESRESIMYPLVNLTAAQTSNGGTNLTMTVTLRPRNALTMVRSDNQEQFPKLYYA